MIPTPKNSLISSNFWNGAANVWLFISIKSLEGRLSHFWCELDDRVWVPKIRSLYVWVIADNQIHRLQARCFGTAQHPSCHSWCTSHEAQRVFEWARWPVCPAAVQQAALQGSPSAFWHPGRGRKSSQWLDDCHCAWSQKCPRCSEIMVREIA